MDGDKSQLVRLADVFVFGPLMIAAARSQRSTYFRTALTLIGLGTIIYNGANYLQNVRAQQAGTVAGLEGQAPYTRPARH